jgi:hypothetical protein
VLMSHLTACLFVRGLKGIEDYSILRAGLVDKKVRACSVIPNTYGLDGIEKN